MPEHIEVTRLRARADAHAELLVARDEYREVPQAGHFRQRYP